MRAVAPPHASAERVPGSTMRIELGGPVFDSRPELRAYAEQRLLSTLGHLARCVASVALRGEPPDMRPPKGTLRCRVLARLVNGRELVGDEVDADPYDAIDRAVETLARDVEYVESRLPPGGGLRCA